MRLLVLGGTHFLGRHVATAALDRGHEVATFTRGVSGAPPEGARALHGDRDDPAALPTALDAPDIRIVRLVEERDVVAPFGAKAVSAVPVVTSPAAVASAVRAATGRPVNRLPIRPQAAVVTERS